MKNNAFVLETISFLPW